MSLAAVTIFGYHGVFPVWVQAAQVLKPPWNDVRWSPKGALGDVPSVSEQFHAMVNITRFESTDTKLQVVGRGRVTSRDKFQNFRGLVPEFASWEEVIETHCQGGHRSTTGMVEF